LAFNRGGSEMVAVDLLLTMHLYEVL